nr:MAG: hypothetical protein [Apis mellifera filamentous virus]
MVQVLDLNLTWEDLELVTNLPLDSIFEKLHRKNVQFYLCNLLIPGPTNSNYSDCIQNWYSVVRYLGKEDR